MSEAGTRGLRKRGGPARPQVVLPELIGPEMQAALRELARQQMSPEQQLRLQARALLGRLEARDFALESAELSLRLRDSVPALLEHCSPLDLTRLSHLAAGLEVARASHQPLRAGCPVCGGAEVRGLHRWTLHQGGQLAGGSVGGATLTLSGGLHPRHSPTLRPGPQALILKVARLWNGAAGSSLNVRCTSCGHESWLCAFLTTDQAQGRALETP